MSFVKAGAVVAVRVDEWFKAHDVAHRVGYELYVRTGKWPEGLLPDTIWFHPGWERWVQDQLAGSLLPRTVAEQVARLDEVNGAIKQAVHLPVYALVELSIVPVGPRLMVRASLPNGFQMPLVEVPVGYQGQELVDWLGLVRAMAFLASRKYRAEAEHILDSLGC